MERVLDVVVMIASLTLIAIIIIVGWDYAQRGRVQKIIERYAQNIEYSSNPMIVCTRPRCA